MKLEKQLFVTAIILIAGISAFAQQEKYHRSFLENFNRSSSKYFQPVTGGKGADFIWRFGVRSPTERKTKILSFKIDPEDAAGAGRGPEVISNYFTHFGTYAARLKIPDVRNIQPDAGAVVGCFLNPRRYLWRFVPYIFHIFD